MVEGRASLESQGHDEYDIPFEVLTLQQARRMIALDTNIRSTRSARMHRFELWSADRDFSRFPGFDVVNSLVWRG